MHRPTLLPTTNMPEYPPGDPGPLAALTAPDVPLFCTVCGRPLVPRQEPREVNTKTGAREHDLQLVCPRLVGLFGWLLGQFHDVWTWYDYGEEGPRLKASRRGRPGYWNKATWR